MFHFSHWCRAILSIALLLFPIIYSPLAQAFWPDCGFGYFSKQERFERRVLQTLIEEKEADLVQLMSRMESTVNRWRLFDTVSSRGYHPLGNLRFLLNIEKTDSPELISLATVLGLRSWISSVLDQSPKLESEIFGVPKGSTWEESLKVNQGLWVNQTFFPLIPNTKNYDVEFYLYRSAARLSALSLEDAVDFAIRAGSLLYNGREEPRALPVIESIEIEIRRKAEWLYEEAKAEVISR